MDSVSPGSQNILKRTYLGWAGADAVPLCSVRNVDALGNWFGIVRLGVFQVESIAIEVEAPRWAGLLSRAIGRGSKTDHHRFGGKHSQASLGQANTFCLSHRVVDNLDILFKNMQPPDPAMGSGAPNTR